jgi:hypothetical protein
MKGAGYYDRHSSAQLTSIQALQVWVDQAVANLPLAAPEKPIAVLDLGCSEGRNAIRVMASIVAGFRQRTDQPLQTIYSDLNSNNFNQLFANLEVARRAGSLGPGVFPSAVGGSFYSPLLPPGTVHFATSFNSIQWLDRLPAVAVPDFVIYRRPHRSRPGVAVSPEATAAFQEQAEQDLVRFLQCRARELVPGGKLLLASPGETDEASICDGFADVLNDACLDLVSAGQLQQEDFERFTLPVYFRTQEELLAPLQRKDSPVRGAFVLDRAQALEIPTPFVVAFQRDGDAAAYAAAYTGFLRAITEPVVRVMLQQTEEAAGTVAKLYQRIHARLLAEPQRYHWRYIVVAALLTRR